MVLKTKLKFLKLTKRPGVRNENVLNEQRFIFVVRNEQRFPLLFKRTTLLESSWCCRKQRARPYFLFKVFKSDLLSIFYFRRLDFFPIYMTKNYGRHDSGSGRHDLGEVTLGRLDQLPLWLALVQFRHLIFFSEPHLCIINLNVRATPSNFYSELI